MFAYQATILMGLSLESTIYKENAAQEESIYLFSNIIQALHHLRNITQLESMNSVNGLVCFDHRLVVSFNCDYLHCVCSHNDAKRLKVHPIINI